MSGWPGKWHSKVPGESSDEVTFTNDHGTRWLCGNTEDGQWLKMTGDVRNLTC